MRVTNKGWRDDGRKYWPWEGYGDIVVCGLDQVARSSTDEITRYSNKLFAELGFQIMARIADSQVHDVVRPLVEKSIEGDEILCRQLENALWEARQSGSLLLPGLIVGFDGKRLRLNDEGPSDNPPLWGWTSDDGLVLLRLCKNQPLENVVRHELGHLLFGLGHRGHDGSCLMEYDCHEREFCKKCLKEIRETAIS